MKSCPLSGIKSALDRDRDPDRPAGSFFDLVRKRLPHPVPALLATSFENLEQALLRFLPEKRNIRWFLSLFHASTHQFQRRFVALRRSDPLHVRLFCLGKPFDQSHVPSLKLPLRSDRGREVRFLSSRLSAGRNSPRPPNSNLRSSENRSETFEMHA